MRGAALALLLFTGGCTSAAETAYREQIECLALFEVPDGMAEPSPGCCSAETEALHRQSLAKRDAFRGRAAERGRALGKTQEQVSADVRAARTTLDAELGTMGSHPAEERLEQLDALCTRRLRS